MRRKWLPVSHRGSVIRFALRLALDGIVEKTTWGPLGGPGPFAERRVLRHERIPPSGVLDMIDAGVQMRGFRRAERDILDDTPRFRWRLRLDAARPEEDHANFIEWVTPGSKDFKRAAQELAIHDASETPKGGRKIAGETPPRAGSL